MKAYEEGKTLQVAPFAGAWIETFLLIALPFTSRSPPSRGRGLKRVDRKTVGSYRGRPLRGGVD